jgi:hypothetical protein
MDKRNSSIDKIPTTLVQLIKQQVETSKSRIDNTQIKNRDSVGSRSNLDEKDDLLNSPVLSALRARASSVSKLAGSKKSIFNYSLAEVDAQTARENEKNSPFTSRKIED